MALVDYDPAVCLDPERGASIAAVVKSFDGYPGLRLNLFHEDAHGESSVGPGNDLILRVGWRHKGREEVRWYGWAGATFVGFTSERVDLIRDIDGMYEG